MSLASLRDTLKPVERMSTGIREFDYVLGGGVVKGSIVLISGAPGTGKSTLLLQTANNIAKGPRSSVLYASGEQNQRDLLLYAERVGAIGNEHLDIIQQDEVYKIIDAAEERKPALLIIDSVNAMYIDDVDADVNSARQIEAIGNLVTSFAKKEEVAVLVVAHQAKDGSIRAPQVLVHLVDTVVYFDPCVPDDDDEASVDTTLRVLETGNKNRYGESNVRKLLEMTAEGLKSTKKGSSLAI